MESKTVSIATTLKIVIILEALIFFLAAAAHLGTPIPLGFAVLSEPRIIPATIVEGLIAIALAISAYAILARKSWAWITAMAAHAFGIAGVVLGIVALAMGRGPRTASNDLYHRMSLIVLAAVLVLLFTRSAKNALARSG